jgi:hypothetical protein
MYVILEEKLNKNISILEYGSGNSSFCYAARVKTVHSVEHNYSWFMKLTRNNTYCNLTLHYKKSRGCAY